MADPKFAGRLLDQFKTLLDATKDKNLSQGDLAVFGEIVDYYKPAKGNAWCTLEHLCTATGSHKSSVMRSLKRLTAGDWLTVVSRGRRGRAAVYVPNFARLGRGEATLFPVSTPTFSGGGAGGGGEKQGSADAILSTELGSADALLSTELGSADAHPLDLPPATYKVDGRVRRDGVDPDAVAPPPPASAPSGAGGAASGFEEVWRRYGLKLDRSKAKAAFATLAPDPDLFGAMLTAADVWRSTYEERGTESRWRVRLHNWLGDERYLEEPPPPREPPKKRSRREAATGPAAAPPSPVEAPDKRRVVRILGCSPAEMEDGQGGIAVDFEFQDGGTMTRHYNTYSDRPAITELVWASGRPALNDSDDLNGAELVVVFERDRVRFEPVEVAA